MPVSSTFCRALYDYEATCPEELTFEEGQVIQIIRKTAHDVDDGWWQGEIDGKVGLFPSLVVEECRMDGEPLTPDVRSLQILRCFVAKLIVIHSAKLIKVRNDGLVEFNIKI